MGDIHYTNHGYDLWLKDLASAEYFYSSSYLGGVVSGTLPPPIQILDRSQFWGEISFQYKCASPIWLTFGFYLNDQQVYTYGWVYLTAASDYTYSDARTDGKLGLLSGAGLSQRQTLDAHWQVWLSTLTLPPSQIYYDLVVNPLNPLNPLLPVIVSSSYGIGDYKHSQAYVYWMKPEFDMSQPDSDYG